MQIAKTRALQIGKELPWGLALIVPERIPDHDICTTIKYYNGFGILGYLRQFLTAGESVNLIGDLAMAPLTIFTAQNAPIRSDTHESGKRNRARLRKTAAMMKTIPPSDA